jgi:preprotein translocase subunit SecG
MILFALRWEHYAFMIPLAVVSIFLILVILVQRGRGGGLTGALGGMGGASAFGTKAGDLFTKITIGVAFVWVILAMAALKVLNESTPFSSARGTGSTTSTSTDPAGKVPGDGASSTTPASGTPAAAPKTSGSSTPSKAPAKSTPPAKATP